MNISDIPLLHERLKATPRGSLKAYQNRNPMYSSRSFKTDKSFQDGDFCEIRIVYISQKGTLFFEIERNISAEEREEEEKFLAMFNSTKLPELSFFLPELPVERKGFRETNFKTSDPLVALGFYLYQRGADPRKIEYLGVEYRSNDPWLYVNTEMGYVAIHTKYLGVDKGNPRFEYIKVWSCFSLLSKPKLKQS